MTGRIRRAHECLRHAVAQLDALLADRGRGIDEELTQATACVVRLRDALIDAQREGADAGADLRQVNAVLSLLVGSHYTLVGLRWQRMEKARDELRALLRRYG